MEIIVVDCELNRSKNEASDNENDCKFAIDSTDRDYYYMWPLKLTYSIVPP